MSNDHNYKRNSELLKNYYVFSVGCIISLLFDLCRLIRQRVHFALDLCEMVLHQLSCKIAQYYIVMSHTAHTDNAEYSPLERHPLRILWSVTKRISDESAKKENKIKKEKK